MASRVTVRGMARLRARPDVYAIDFQLTRLEASAQAALEAIAGRSRDLEAAFRRAGLGDAGWSTSGLTVREELEWDGERRQQRHRGYRASVELSVRHSDPELASRLVHAATGRPEARVEGPRWSISPEHPARLEACRRAAEDGRRRALAYAQALGLRLGAVVEVSEPEVRPRPRPAGRFLADAAPTGEPGIDLEPGEREVVADVEIAFDLEPA